MRYLKSRNSRTMICYFLSVTLLSLCPTLAQTTMSSQIQDLSNRNADFASRLYRAVSSQTDQNLCLNPFVLSTGLSALMSGADGTTQHQLVQGLSLTGLDPQAVPDLFQSLIEGSIGVRLQQGIAIQPAQKFQVLPSYQELVQSKYHGNIQSLDYTTPQDARDIINRWIQDQSGDQVQKTVDAVDPQTQLLLTTSSNWQSEFTLAFNSSFTSQERFYVDKYHIVMVPMMFRADKYFLAYDRSLGVGVLKLPMTVGTAMLVIFPDENVDLNAVEQEVTAEKIQAWIKQLKKTKLEVQVPRFLLDSSYSLRDVLQNLLITEVFEDNADLSNISDDKSLKLTQVLHKAVISADDNASSSERGSGAIFSSPPPRLTINRPFLFIVYHEMSGSVLLMGRVVDPTKK